MDFKKLAQEFEERIRTTAITPTTDVNLICYAVDADGHAVPPFKLSLTPVTKANFLDPAFAKSFAGLAHLEAICDTMNAFVPNTTDQLTMNREGPPYPIKIVNFDLEIRDDAA